MNRLPSRIAPALIALAALLSAPAAPGAPLSADCGPPPAGAMCLDGPWFDFATMNVRLVQGTVTANHEITQGAGQDLLVRTDETNPRFRGRAEAMLIAGAVVATRSDGSLPATGEELLGDPLLASQEVAGLLQTALPRGPGVTTGRRRIDVAGTRVFTAQTPQSTSLFGPPWRLEGTVTAKGARAFDFELVFSFRLVGPDSKVSERRHVHRYRGSATYPVKRPAIPDSMSLAGWRITGPQGGTYTYATLGEARRALGVAPAR